MRTRKILAGLLLGAVFLLGTSSTFGQEVDAAVVVGSVLDPSQAAVSNATVTFTHLDTNAATVVHTNERGEYRSPSLRIGEYEVSVEAAGFKRFSQHGVILNIGDVREVDATLELGEVSQSVTVESTAPILQTSDSTVGTVVTNHQITELPLNGRDYLQLAALSSGTTSGGSGGVTIGGEAGSQVAFLLDGQDNNNQQISTGHSGQKDIVEPSIDAIQEFEVVTNGYSAEYGRSSSGVISAAIKSGTNQFHGVGYEFVRNEALDSSNFFLTPGSSKPPFGRNQYGGAIGGPVIRNKTFFFGDFEIGRIRESSTTLSQLPTDAQRAGDFTTSVKNPYTGQPFPQVVVNGVTYYQVPSGSVDQIAQKIENLLPQPNLAVPVGNKNYEYNGPANTDAHRWDFRADQILSDEQNLSFRYSSQVTGNGVTSPLPPTSGEGFYSGGGAQVTNSTSFVLTHNRIWTPTLASEIHLGWNYLNWINTFPPQRLTGIGIPGVNSSNPGFSGVTVSGTGITLPGLGISNVPNEDGSQNRQLSGDLTWTKGAHNVKFGVQAYWLQTNFYSSQNSSGNFTFNGEYTGHAYADFLLGYASASTLSTYARLNFRTPETHFFVQDDWKVNRKLTLNIGLRYEYTPPAVDVNNGLSNYEENADPYVGTPVLVQAGADGGGRESRSLQSVYYHQIAPRFGFAYSLGSKTVVRGGYGLFYSNVITIGGMQSLEKNPPNSITVNPSPTSKAVPSLFLQDGFPSGTLSLANTSNVQLNSWDTRATPPTDYQWNINVQRQLPGAILVEAGYDGNNFDHNWWQIDGNPAPLTATPVGSLNSRRIFQTVAVPTTPYTITLASVKRIQHDGYSRYNAAHIKVEKRYTNSLSFIASYAYSKTMALGDASGLQNPDDWAAEYAVAGTDMTHHFVGSVIYDLPFGRGKRFGASWNRVTNAFVGGWAIDPIVTFDSGLPVNLAETLDNSNTGQNDRPNVVGNWRLSNPSVNEWFNTAAFAVNPVGTFGNTGRNILRAPGLTNVDLAAHKSFQISERVSTQLRVESFNFTNTPPLGSPGATLGASGFGEISSAGNPRQIQFGVKVIF